jgi:hypothetical protein
MKKYAGYFNIILVIVGIIVLRFQIVAYVANNKEISVLKSEISDLRTREVVLEDQKALFDSKMELWKKLNIAVPDNADFQNYILTDLLMSWAEIGFSIENVTPQTSTEPHTRLVTVDLTGDALRSYQVLEQVYKHPRAAKVENVKIISDKAPNHVVLTMRIYALDLAQLNDAKIDIEFLERELEPAHELY